MFVLMKYRTRVISENNELFSVVIVFLNSNKAKTKSKILEISKSDYGALSWSV